MGTGIECKVMIAHCFLILSKKKKKIISDMVLWHFPEFQAMISTVFPTHTPGKEVIY